MSSIDIPYTLLALAPFGSPKSSLVPADIYSIDEAMTFITPRIEVPLPKDLYPPGVITLEFTRFKQLRPDHLIKSSEALRSLTQAMEAIDEALATHLPPTLLAEKLRSRWPHLPIDWPSVAEKSAPTSALDNILSMVDTPGQPSPSSSQPLAWRARIEAHLASLVRHITSSEAFRTCEEAWRGVKSLLDQGQVKGSRPVRVMLAPADRSSLPEVLDDLLQEPMSQGTPNLILIDIPFDSSLPSIALLGQVGELAESLLAPAVCWATPALLHLEGWPDLARLPYLRHHLEDVSFAKWRKLRGSPLSGWLALCCNRYLGRLTEGEEPLWLSPVWALGGLVAKSMAQFGWPGLFTQYTHVGLDDLPLCDHSSGGMLCVETALEDDRIKQMAEVGLIPLVGGLGQDRAIMPHEAALDGGSLRSRLFLSRLLGFLFWCKENRDQEINQGDRAANLEALLKAIWARTGQEFPDDLHVSAGDPLTITMTPPLWAMADQRSLELTFSW